MPSNSNDLDFANLHLRGREEDIAQLQEAYRGARSSALRQHHVQVVWLHGYSGVGKSTLVEHALGSMPNFCSGKYDQSRSAQPFSALATVLIKLCYILQFDCLPIHLSSDDTLVLATIVPEIRDVLDTDYTSCTRDDECEEELPMKSEWRTIHLRQALLNFIEQVCKILKEPLILFLDDLQWADADSLEIVKALLLSGFSGNGARLLFVGSYRENEVDDCHPLHLCIEETKNEHTIKLSIANLDRESMAQVVVDLTHMEISDAEELSDLVYSKTHGNCFYTLHMLRHIHNQKRRDKKFLFVSQTSGHWEWKAEKIRLEIGLSENVVEFMTKKLRSLPDDELEVLKLASCLGSHVDIELLTSIWTLFHSSEEVERTTAFDITKTLKMAVDENLVDISVKDGRLTFSHDRIQSAAYEMIPTERDRQILHLQIGRHLLKEVTDDDTRQRRFLLAVDQLNRGSEIVEDDRAERVELAQLNLAAAKQVVKTYAFKMAASFLVISVDLLGIFRWSHHYELILEITNTLASVLFSNGETDSCLYLVEEIYTHARCQADKQRAQILHVEVLAGKSRLPECIAVCLCILRQLGHRKMPGKPGLLYIGYSYRNVDGLLKNKTNEDLLKLPLCKDLTILATMRVLGSLAPVAFMANREALTPVLCFRMMELSIKFGVSQLSPFAFSLFGIARAAMGNFEEAFRFATLALEMMSERFCEDARTLVMVHGLLNHIKRPLLDSVDHTLRAYNLSFSQGDLTLAGEACTLHCHLRMAAGLGLANIANDALSFYSQLKGYNQVQKCNALLVQLRAILELMNRASSMPKLTGEVLDDRQFENHIGNCKADMVLYFFWMYAMESRFILGKLDSSIEFAEKCWLVKLSNAFVFTPAYLLISSLAALDQWKATGKRRYWRVFRKFYKELKSWSTKGNPNTVHSVALLDAELLVVGKAKAIAVHAAYDKSISIAICRGFVQDAALANERAGKYCLGCGRSQDWACHYLSAAKELFIEWGATAKVIHMEQHFGELAGDSTKETTSLGFGSSSRNSSTMTGNLQQRKVALTEKSQDAKRRHVSIMDTIESQVEH